MRVSVVGTSGAGKTTFAERLAAQLGCPHIDLDQVNWQAGWRDLNSHDPPEFRRRVGAAAAGEAWVCSGNYSKVADLVRARATHLVWLDLPRWQVMLQVIRRSFLRAVTKDELWPGTGNVELFRNWIDPEHPIRWAWDTHARRRRQYDEMMQSPDWAHMQRFRVSSRREGAALIDELARGAAPT